MARIMRRGVKYQKNFSVKKNGGWIKSRKLAAAWIAEQKEKLPPSEMNQKGRMSAKNRSGVVGVYLENKKTKGRQGGEYIYRTWSARWPGCPFKGGISWPVGNKFTEEEAFVLAYLAREMECVDRDVLQAKLRRIRNRSSYQKMLSLKKL